MSMVLTCDICKKPISSMTDVYRVPMRKRVRKYAFPLGLWCDVDICQFCAAEIKRQVLSKQEEN